MQYPGRENRMSVVMRILAVAVFAVSIAACGASRAVAVAFTVVARDRRAIGNVCVRRP